MLIRKYVCPIQLQLSWSLVRLKSCSWNGTSLSSFPWHRKMDSNLLSSWQRCLKWPARLGPCFSLPSLPVLLPSFETPHLLSAGPTVEVSTLGFQSVKSCGLKMPFFFFLFRLNYLIELTFIFTTIQWKQTLGRGIWCLWTES